MSGYNATSHRLWGQLGQLQVACRFLFETKGKPSALGPRLGVGQFGPFLTTRLVSSANASRIPGKGFGPFSIFDT